MSGGRKRSTKWRVVCANGGTCLICGGGGYDAMCAITSVLEDES